MGSQYDTYALNTKMNGEEKEFKYEHLKKAMPEGALFREDAKLVNVT